MTAIYAPDNEPRMESFELRLRTKMFYKNPSKENNYKNGTRQRYGSFAMQFDLSNKHAYQVWSHSNI